MKNISESELEVMQTLWTKGASTSLEIIKDVTSRRAWKNNTIMTLVKRLTDKGFIEVIREKGNLLLYKPTVLEDEYKAKETESFIERMYKGSINNMLVAFAKSKKLSKKDLEELMELIEEDN